MNPEPVVPISALEHHLYCPRQCALIHVDGIWFDNEFTVRGTYGHRRADAGGGRLERGRTVLRSVPLWSEAIGLSGRADAVEVAQDGSMAPAEYKIGTRHGDAAHVQLCAEALCLEEMTGRPVPVGYLWLAAHRRRLAITFSDELRRATMKAIDEVRAWMASDCLPIASNDRRCRECQLRDHCQPELTACPSRVSAHLRRLFSCES